jgi:hypothetical protein
VARIVAARGWPAQVRSATGYDDERDRAGATYANLRRNCHPLPEDAAGSGTRRSLL